MFETLNIDYSTIYRDIKIIGITGLVYSENKNSLYSMELLKKYINNNIKINSILVKTDESNKQWNILKKFPYDSKYSVYSLYSSEVENYNRGIQSHINFIIITLIILLIFSIIFITNFIINNIYVSKKNIGILKSLGARNIDIVKIFIFEQLIICIMIYFISICNSVFVFDYLNRTLMQSTHMIISPFYITFDKSVIIFIYILCITLISSIMPLNKISKMKPIDAIYDK